MSALRVERDGAVLRITLARPERRNAFDAELIRELTEAFSDVGDARAGYSVPPAAIERLRERAPNLAGLKVSNQPFENVEPYLVESLDVFVGAESLVLREQDSFAGRPERQDPVEASVGQIAEVRRERVLVESASPLPKRRDRSGERSFQHAPTLSSRA